MSVRAWLAPSPPCAFGRAPCWVAAACCALCLPRGLQNVGDSVINDSHLWPYPPESRLRPLAVAPTEFHFYVLYSDRIQESLLSLLTETALARGALRRRGAVRL